MGDLPCGVLSVDNNGLIVAANGTLASYVGVAVDDLVGSQVTKILSAGSRAFYQTHVYPQLRLRGRIDECYLTLLRHDGHDVHVLVNGARSDADPEEHVVVVLPVPRRHQLEAELIDARRRAQDALAAEEKANRKLAEAQREIAARQHELTSLNVLLESQAAHDDLTGLYNRRHFRAALDMSSAHAGREGTPVSLLLLDLDHFKAINDRFGHNTGDEVLVRASASLLEVARDGDSVFRYGGEEFAIILPGTTTEHALRLSQRVLAAIAELELPGFRVTVSIGVSGSPPLEPDPHTLVAAADLALYAAKRSGRNRVVEHDSTMVERGADPQELVEDRTAPP